MTTAKAKLILFLIILTISLISCSHNQIEKPATAGMPLPTVSKTVYPVINLPVWMLYLPEGQNVIGIAVNNAKKPQATDKSCREFALLSQALNRSAITIDRDAFIKYAEQNSTESPAPEYAIRIVTEQAQPEKAESDFNSYAETSFNNFKAQLFGASPQAFDKGIIQASVATTPLWCKGNTAYEENGYLYTVGVAINPGLITAWQNAQKDALIKQAQYRLKNILGDIRNAKDTESKHKLIDAALQNPNPTLAKTWFFQKIENNVSTYSVYLLYKTKK